MELPSGREANAKRFLIERTSKAGWIVFTYKHVLVIIEACLSVAFES